MFDDGGMTPEESRSMDSYHESLREERDRKTIADLRRQLEATTKNRDRYCDHINRIGRDVLGFGKDNCAPDAVSREIEKMVTDLRAELAEAKKRENLRKEQARRVALIAKKRGRQRDALEEAVKEQDCTCWAEDKGVLCWRCKALAAAKEVE